MEESNRLSYSFVRAVEFFQPTTASLENVEGMFQTKHVDHLKRILSSLFQCGYQVRVSLLNARNYGDPQSRRRLFLFAAKKSWQVAPIPAATHGIRQGQQPLVVVRDVLSDLEDVEPKPGHGISYNHQEGGNMPVYNHNTSAQPELSPLVGTAQQIYPDKPCQTILTNGGLIHYSKNRKLTVREVARLMSFPDSMQLFGTQTAQFTQLGNAVPIKLATAVAQSIAATYGLRK